MTVLKADYDVLARAVADSLVIAADPDARASPLYWQAAEPSLRAVVDAVRSAADEEIRFLGERLLQNPARARGHAELVDALLRQEPEQSPLAALFELAWAAECPSRLGYHVGPGYMTDVPAIQADDLCALPAGLSSAGGDSSEVLVVIPFRDRDPGAVRLRNLLACLLSLRDQSYPREGYCVVVVETDNRPRWRDVIAPRTDYYLFAPSPGPFNKSWAVNVGATHCPGQPEVICILDGDVLSDRDFIARNTARFRQPGTVAHLTYRDMFCLDPASSARAIRDRLWEHAAAPDPARLRGFLLRRPPGCCVWVRAEAFHRIGGMDERYEGWGGEDYDFAQRLNYAAPLDTYDDSLLHLSHPPASVLGPNGQHVNAQIPSMSWRPTGPIGRLDRFTVASAADGGHL